MRYLKFFGATVLNLVHLGSGNFVILPPEYSSGIREQHFTTLANEGGSGKFSVSLGRVPQCFCKNNHRCSVTAHAGFNHVTTLIKMRITWNQGNISVVK